MAKSIKPFEQLKSRNSKFVLIFDIDVRQMGNGPVNVATPSPVIYWKRAVVPKVGIEIRCKGYT